MAFGDATYLSSTHYQEVVSLVSATGTTYQASNIAGSIYERAARAEIVKYFKECGGQSKLDEIVAGSDTEQQTLLRDAYLYQIAANLVQTSPRLSSQESAGLSQEWVPADLDMLRSDLIQQSKQLLDSVIDSISDSGDCRSGYTMRIHFTRGGPDVC